MFRDIFHWFIGTCEEIQALKFDGEKLCINQTLGEIVCTNVKLECSKLVWSLRKIKRYG